ncbi:restriction endonuclease subunit S [Rothia sp. P7208]|uniref:restriction endonuclease subunit S n=1 Tax=Rothia sp. P7208 TaxID=3402660 RepID=UPI003ACF3B92
MSVLETLDFQPMLITDVFDSVTASKAWYDKNKIQPGPRSYPYVSRSRLYNGHESVVGYQDLPPNAGNAITIGVDTQSVFYQPAPFYTSVKIQVLRHSLMTTASALVLVAVLRGQMMKFQWGNGVSLDRLRVSHIMVPAIMNADGTVEADWEGMDRLGTELLDQVVTQTHSARATSSTDDDTLPALRFEPMFITDVFDSMTASKAWYDKAKLVHVGAAIFPFVSRTKASNGVDRFCSRQDKDPELGNALTIGLDTQTIGYQPVPFYTGQNIQVLRHEYLDGFNAPVLASLIRGQMGKFSWGGNGATLGRLKVTQIMVPVVTDASGESVVDWEGMSAYGHALRVRAERSLEPVLG